MVKDNQHSGQVQTSRRPGFRFNKEVSKFRTITAVDSFTVAGREFSKKFKCCYNESKRIVAKDRPRRYADYESYTFGCACRSGNFVLQFRHCNAAQVIGKKKSFVYRVFVKEKEVEDALLHFKEVLADGTATDNDGTVKEKGSSKRGRSVKSKVHNENDNCFCEREESKLIYSHHHVEKFLEVPLVSNVSAETVSYLSGAERKIQFVTDGKVLAVENFSKGILATQYPICVVDSPESIGMKVQLSTRTGRVGRSAGDKGSRLEAGAGKFISIIANIVGNSTEVTVINVRDQQEVEGWTFGALAKYFCDENRVEVLNQVSFEFSGTPLVNYVTSPQFVREVDWNINTWPTQFQHPRYSKAAHNRTLRTAKQTIYYPLVQYYCVTSSAGAYMDFHIDVGGTSFWYHLVCGRKQFLFIEPTEDNIKQYKKWVCSNTRNETFFPDLVKDKLTVCKMLLEENKTLVVPSGWIHAVYTEKDSLAFGGNFLNGYSAEMQIRINELEIKSDVADKFRCPYFNISNLFAADALLRKMQLRTSLQNGKDIIFEEELKQLACLLEYIVSEYLVVLQSKRGKISTHNEETCTYKSVYDEPRFEDAVQYVLRQHGCPTMEKYLLKFLALITQFFS